MTKIPLNTSVLRGMCHGCHLGHFRLPYER